MTKKVKQQTEEIQKISFEDILKIIKLLSTSLGFVVKIMESIERSKNAKEKQEIIKAIFDTGDADIVNRILSDLLQKRT